jgi:hypothetical protein
MPPIEAIDLRDSVACARCGEQLAIWTYNGDLEALVCTDCARVPTSVVGSATSFATIG